MKLAAAMEQTVLREATVVAGSGAMNREITWVHIVDHPDITNWLKPGDLLLTTGYNWPENDEASRNMVRELARLRLAGVVLAVPHFREHFSAAAIDEANKLDLPLLELPWDVHFSQITQDVLAPIIDMQAETIRRSDLIHRTLTAASNLEGVVSALRGSLEKDATIVSISGDVIETSRLAIRDVEERALMARLTTRESLPHLFRTNAPFIFKDPSAPAGRLAVPIRTNDEILGVLWLDQGEAVFEELDSKAIEHAGVIAALHLTHQRELSDLETRLGYAFVAGLLEGKFSATPSAIERAKASGWSESRGYRVCLLLLDEPIPLSMEGFTRRTRLTNRVAQVLQEFNCPPLISVSLNQISFLLPGEVSADSIWRALRDEGGALAVSRLHFGVAGMAVGAEDVAALTPLLKLGTLHNFDEVLFSRALMGDSDARRLLVEKLILPLESPKRGIALTDTLMTLASEGFQLLHAARALGIHISTLRYRLGRIETILGIALDDPEARFKLQVACEMFSLMSER
jgi:purine catabolism regulator